MPTRRSDDGDNDDSHNNNDTEMSKSRFFTISSLLRQLSPSHTLKWPGRNRVQITWNTSTAYHMQYDARRVERRGTSAIKLDGADITFISTLFHWLKFSTDGEGVCLLVASRPSNMRVYLRDGAAQTILRAATLR